MHLKILQVLLLLVLTGPAWAKTHYLCVFDPIGRNGDVFTTATDLVTDYLEFGVKFKLYPYSTESEAAADFKSGLCDGVVHTGFNSREYNVFTSSIEAVGGILDTESMKDILFTLSQPKAAPLFVNGEYEVAAIYPAGAVYIHTVDKSLTTVTNLEGKRIFVLHEDVVSPAMVDIVGGIPVRGDTTNFASLLKTGKVDVTYSPVVLTEPLELDKAIEKTGGIIRYPLFYLTLQFIIRKDSFPDGFGQMSRENSLNHFERAVEIETNATQKISPHLWLDIGKEEREEWDAAHELISEELVDKGIYDERMLRIMKRVRCKRYPERYECNKS